MGSYGPSRIDDYLNLLKLISSRFVWIVNFNGITTVNKFNQITIRKM